MKKVFKVLTVAVFVLTAMSFTDIQAKETKIKVNGICGICKAKIEKTAKSVKGVKTATWNEETKELKLDFNEKLTNVKAISTAIAKVGYDAGEVKADKDARAKLPACCKGEGEGHGHHGDKGCSSKK